MCQSGARVLLKFYDKVLALKASALIECYVYNIYYVFLNRFVRIYSNMSRTVCPVSIQDCLCFDVALSETVT